MRLLTTNHSSYPRIGSAPEEQTLRHHRAQRLGLPDDSIWHIDRRQLGSAMLVGTRVSFQSQTNNRSGIDDDSIG